MATAARRVRARRVSRETPPAAPTTPTTRARLDLERIRAALDDFARAIPALNRELDAALAPLAPASRDALVAAYAELDRLHALGVDLLAPGESRRLLALNRIVLHGARGGASRHAATERRAASLRYYDAPRGGIGDLVAWYERRRRRPAPRLAAGLYVRLQCSPQLFVEGNHRTGMLLASHVLLRARCPPLVMTPALAAPWFALTPELQRLDRHGARLLFAGPRLTRRAAALIERHVDPRWLVGERRP